MLRYTILALPLLAIAGCATLEAPRPAAPEPVTETAPAAPPARSAKASGAAPTPDGADSVARDASRSAAAPKTDAPDADPNPPQRGVISLYGPGFEGKPTASGETFDPEALTMAHRTLPFGTRVRVTNLENQRSVDVVVNDRGPFVRGRIADLSVAAARRIGMINDGVVEGLVEILAPGKSR